MKYITVLSFFICSLVFANENIVTFAKDTKMDFTWPAIHASLVDVMTISSLSNARSISQNSIVTTDYSQINPPQWGLWRVSQLAPPSDGSYDYWQDGTGVTVYIIDSGIAAHTEFGTRLQAGYDVSGGSTTDCLGHGTHVAGIAAGAVSGFAKNADIVPVRVFTDCTSSTLVSDVLTGMQWVIDNAQLPAVANISLGTASNQAMDDMVAAMVASGIVVTVSAGNDNGDACLKSPAGAPEAITVAATDLQDNRKSSSNYGDCVDIYAPGHYVKSSGLSDDYVIKSGTSMSAPQAAGVAALVLQANPDILSSGVEGVLTHNALQNIVTNVVGNTLFLNSMFLPQWCSF